MIKSVIQGHFIGPLFFAKSVTAMRPHILLFSLFMLSIADFSQAAVRIINGRAASPHQWEWMVALIDNTQAHVTPVEICGASLVASDWLLTAAHCVVGENIFTLAAWIGDVDLSSVNGKTIALKRIVIHPQYKDDGFHPPLNDLALVQLSQVVTQNPVRLSNAYNPFTFADDTAVVMGWGTTSVYSSNYPLMLQQTTVPITTQAECNSFYAYNGSISDSMVCAGFPQGGTDACTGDSGGPLVIPTPSINNVTLWQQLGIVSFGEGCAQANHYGVYTRVTSYEDFIQSTLCDAGNTPVAPTLQTSLQGNTVQLNWEAVQNATGYQLFYAPYSAPIDQQTLAHITSIELGQQTSFSTQLSAGQNFYVTVKAYQNNCNSAYSNLGTVKVP